MSELKVIHADKTSGPALAICPYCRNVVGDTTVLLTMPFYPVMVGYSDAPLAPELLKIPFKPVAYCQCGKE